MGLWAKSVVIFKAIREHGKQSIRSLADRTGLSKSSVHRHLQAIDRRDRYPESSLWETEPGRAWLIRLMVATLFEFGLKRGVGAETLSEFFGRLRLEGNVGCSPSALRTVMYLLERLLLDTAAARVAVSQHATPAAVEDRRRRLELLEAERGVVARETQRRYRRDDRLAELDEAIAAADTLLLTIPNQLGVDYNAHLLDSIVRYVAPELGWR